MNALTDVSSETMARSVAGPVISARQVRKVFGSGELALTVLHDVDLEVARGEFMMLVGPSGSGKTTLLSILGCTMTATSGSLVVLGEEVTRLSPSRLAALRLGRIGFVFQGHNLLASHTALENVALPLELSGVKRREALDRARALLDRVGLADRAGHLPRQLSGGQAQRVAICRALVGDPPILLADEPTAALDASSGRTVTELMRKLAEERRAAVVVVTHDSRIYDLADRIVRIEDGRIQPAENLS